MNRTQASGEHRPQIRQACCSDQAGIKDFLASLSLRTRYLRFFTGAMPTSPAMLRVLAGEGDRIDAVVAIENGVIIGHAMAGDTIGPGAAHLTEIGVVVMDSCQGRGVGSALVRTVLARAQARGVTAVTMEVLTENRQVLTMITGHWPAACHGHSGAYTTIHTRLSQPAQERPPRPSEGPLSSLGKERPLHFGEERPAARLASAR